MKTKKSVVVAENHLASAFAAIIASLPVDKRNKTASDFVELKLTKDGVPEGVPLFDTSEKSIAEIYDIGEMIHRFENGAQGLYDYLVNVIIPHRNELLETGQTEEYSSIIFMSPFLEQHRKREEAVLALAEDKGPLTDMTSCIFCGEPKVHRRIGQTRSADEGFTSIFNCPRCARSWTEN